MRHTNGNCLVIGGFCTSVNDEICNGLRNAYACGASREMQRNEWVSVKDGLPPKLTLVLVCNHGIYDIAFVGDRGNWVNKLFEPEYWMPLPEPPKEVSE